MKKAPGTAKGAKRLRGQISGQGGGSGQGAAGNPSFYIARLRTGLTIGAFEATASASEILLYPNPVHSEALLEYELNTDQYMDANIYSMDGTLMRTCLTNCLRKAGKHQEQLRIDPMLPAGVYILQLSSGNLVKTIRFIKD